MATPTLIPNTNNDALGALGAMAQGAPSQREPESSEERTVDAPKAKNDQEAQTEELEKALQDALFDVERKYRDQWAAPRRKRIRDILRAFEYLKGNQYISFDPGQFLWYDPLEAVFEGNTENEDLGIYRYVTNQFQMLWFSFMAALSSEVPKSRFLPDDARKEVDIATAKAGSTLQAIVERKNHIKAMQRLELTHFWTGGAYFKYTRFVVDKARFKTHREPVYGPVTQQVVPDRYICGKCGHETPAAATAILQQPMCEACGSPLSEADFYPGESVTNDGVTGYKDVPNGMVTQSVYGHLNVTIAPYAEGPSKSPGLFLDEEVDIASVRTSYREKWDAIKSESSNRAAGESESERMARQVVNNAVGGRNNMAGGMMPTLTRAWFHPWAYAVLDDKKIVDQLTEKFPDGVLFVHCGDTFLEARGEDMDEKWTWSGTSDGFGAFPPAVGAAALDLQDQINDVSNIIMESTDRNASPETYMDGSMFDVGKLANKPRLPGSIVEVKRKLEQMNRPLSDFIYTPTVSVDRSIYERPMQLFEIAQLITGVMPEIFGGRPNANVDTATGQQQQLNQAMTRLQLFWEAMREEHAAAAELSVRCGAKNFLDDVMNVIGGGGDEFRNQYVRLTDLSGEIHAYVDTDQGFPATFAEIRQRVQEMFLHAKDNPWAAAMLDNPVNARQVATLIGPPDMVIPGDAVRSKTLRIIDKLLQSQPMAQQTVDPVTGVPTSINVPSILPDTDFDDMDVVEKVCKQWGQENWEQMYENPGGFENVRAYLRMAAEINAKNQQTAELEAAKNQPAPAGGQ